MQAFFAITLGITSTVGIVSTGFILYYLLDNYIDWLHGIQLLSARVSRLENIVARLESEASNHGK